MLGIKQRPGPGCSFLSVADELASRCHLGRFAARGVHHHTHARGFGILVELVDFFHGAGRKVDQDVWIGFVDLAQRLDGHKLVGRAAGVDFLLALCVAQQVYVRSQL